MNGFIEKSVQDKLDWLDIDCLDALKKDFSEKYDDIEKMCGDFRQQLKEIQEAVEFLDLRRIAQHRAITDLEKKI